MQVSLSPGGKLSITSRTGSSTAIRRSALVLRSSRITSSSTPISIHESDFDTPIRSLNVRSPDGGIAAPAGADERRHPRIVPAVDVAFLDEFQELALRQHMYVRFSRANSYWCGSGRSSQPPSARRSRIQS